MTEMPNPDDYNFPCLPPPKPPIARGWCRHYGRSKDGQGLFSDMVCDIGVDFMKEFGRAHPCLPLAEGETSPCSKREDWTDEEKAAWKAWSAEHMARMILVAAAFPERKPGQSGQFECPACGVGRVSWATARCNGHLHARCSTPTCFSIIQ